MRQLFYIIVMVFLAALLVLPPCYASENAAVSEDGITLGNPIIRTDLNNCEPKAKILTDEFKDGYWNFRISTWMDGEPVLNSTTGAPDLIYSPDLSGKYDIYVGTREVDWKSDFGVKLSSDDEFTIISPGIVQAHRAVEMLFRKNVSLDGKKIVISSLTQNRSFITYLKFVPILKKTANKVNGNTVVICKETGRHFAFSGVTQAANGDILVVCREGKSHVSEGDYGNVSLIRSKDGGKTWLPRVNAQSSNGVDVRDPSITCMSDGTLILTSTLGVSRSNDNGYTWDAPNVPEIPVFSPRGVYAAQDGFLYYCGIFRSVKDTNYIAIIQSKDKGKSWQYYTTVSMSRPWKKDMTWEFYDEPAMITLPNGRWIVAQRVDIDGYLRLSVSDDKGKNLSWSLPEKSKPLAIWGYPAHMLSLKDGTLLCAYGYRKDPMGIRASISYDGGDTWDMENEYVLRDDGASVDLGYPCSIQLRDGRIFTVYYIHTKTTHPGPYTEIDGVFWSPKKK